MIRSLWLVCVHVRDAVYLWIGFGIGRFGIMALVASAFLGWASLARCVYACSGTSDHLHHQEDAA